ncbi:MAG TPA: phage tail tip lysozyme [Candidatus Saccharimonadales bacterium]|nr:phage tail tip lysozyme [Candidatus Saccharimonadales bacterium]
MRIPSSKLATKALRLTFSLLLCVLTVYSSPGIASAQDTGNVGDEANPDLGLSEEQLRAFRNQILWFNTDIAMVCAGQGGTQLVGVDNIEKAYNFFIGKGMTKMQAAGILGNLRQESFDVTPTAQQDGSKDPFPKNEVGFGIAQWTFTSRQAPLVALAKKQGKPPTDLGVQLDYLWAELNGTHRHALDEMNKPENKNNVGNSTFAFHEKFEGSADTYEMILHRVDLANEVFNNPKYTANNSSAAGKTVTGQAAGDCGGTIVDGYSFPVAPRTKRDYTNLPCTGRKKSPYRDIYGNGATIPRCHHDGSPAFDLMYDGVGDAPIYAITDVTVVRANSNYSMNSGASGRACGSLQVQATKEADPVRHYYWYGHVLLDPGVTEGKNFKAGDKMGRVAPQPYGPRCWGGGPHLHIDRGCVKNPAGKDEASAGPHTGGNDNCRDPLFLTDLKKIWDGLPITGSQSGN